MCECKSAPREERRRRRKRSEREREIERYRCEEGTEDATGPE